ncbi:hypothetical protein EDC01DRAFT_694100 [Geopyxis carbonaria]|nr:hypothetical protein EDC01DRAFT_694100 [Geopyxis carbonaria]
MSEPPHDPKSPGHDKDMSNIPNDNARCDGDETDPAPALPRRSFTEAYAELLSHPDDTETWPSFEDPQGPSTEHLEAYPNPFGPMIHYEPPSLRVRSWRPLEKSDWFILSHSLKSKVHDACRALVESDSWAAKPALAVAVIEDIIDRAETERGWRWIRSEVQRIVVEAMPENSERTDTTRYFTKDSDLCVHKRSCGCWFELTPEAGIKHFPTRSRGRRAAIEFVHGLICELLMRIATYMQAWKGFQDDDQNVVLRRVIELASGDESRAKDDDDDDDDIEDEITGSWDDNERYEYLSLDSLMVGLANGETDLLEDGDLQEMEGAYEEALEVDEEEQDEYESDDGENKPKVHIQGPNTDGNEAEGIESSGPDGKLPNQMLGPDGKPIIPASFITDEPEPEDTRPRRLSSEGRSPRRPSSEGRSPRRPSSEGKSPRRRSPFDKTLLHLETPAPIDYYEFRKEAGDVYADYGVDIMEHEQRQLSPQQQAAVARLCGFLGRRVLTLSVCRWGKGHLFMQRTPIQFWNFNDFVRDNAEKSQPGELAGYLESTGRKQRSQKRYPTRVINTETLDFETDQMLYRKRYAVLSHIWGKNEVSYWDLKRMRANYKERDLNGKLEETEASIIQAQEKLKKALELGAPAEVECIRIEDIIKDLEDHRRQLQSEIALLASSKAKTRQDDKYKNPHISRGNSNSGLAEMASMFAGSSRRPAPDPAMSMDSLEKVSRTLMAVKDLRKPKRQNTMVRALRGEAKLFNAITTARRRGFTYLWVDTCCINKADSSELIESISSMGDWYQNAHTCLIYLHDVDEFSHSKTGTPLEKVKKTRWAERGWTLQEVVMCSRAVFFNWGWREIYDSTKTTERSAALGRVCRAPRALLFHGRKPKVAAAVVLAMAAKRKTTRVEDRAYCLMGILGVRLQADYGEGQDKAIARLLELIIRQNGDVSVFNWGGEYSGSREHGRSMYPVDFDSYTLAAEGHRLPRPVWARDEITLGNSGVHGRFEVWWPRVEFEGGNQQAYEALGVLDRLLEEGQRDVECSVNCKFVDKEPGEEDTDPTKSLAVKVYCSREVLRTQLREELQVRSRKRVQSAWVLARFGRGARWFVCALKFKSQEGASREAIFAANTGFKEDDMLIQYLESRGFAGRRLATNDFDQAAVPQDKLRNLNLWVG